MGTVLEVGAAEAVPYDIGDLFYQFATGNAPLSRVEGEVDSAADLGGEPGIEGSNDG